MSGKKVIIECTILSDVPYETIEDLPEEILGTLHCYAITCAVIPSYWCELCPYATETEVE